MFFAARSEPPVRRPRRPTHRDLAEIRHDQQRRVGYYRSGV